jgi:hypothetical protein
MTAREERLSSAGAAAASLAARVKNTRRVVSPHPPWMMLDHQALSLRIRASGLNRDLASDRSQIGPYVRHRDREGLIPNLLNFI